MQRATVLLVGMVLLCGCQGVNSPMPSMNNLMGRTTVPPPATGEANRLSAATPYYAPVSTSAALQPTSNVGIRRASLSSPDGARTSAKEVSRPTEEQVADVEPSVIRIAAPGSAVPSAEQEVVAGTEPGRLPAELAASDIMALPAAQVRRVADDVAARVDARTQQAAATVDQKVQQAAARVDAAVAQAASWRPSAETQAKLEQAQSTVVQAVGTAQAVVKSASSLAGGRYSYDPQYRWVEGRLEYSPVTERWKLRYIPLSGDANGETDQYGGSVQLTDSHLLEGVASGQFVKVWGHVAQESSTDDNFSPLFQVQQVVPQGQVATPAAPADRTADRGDWTGITPG